MYCTCARTFDSFLAFNTVFCDFYLVTIKGSNPNISVKHKKCLIQFKEEIERKTWYLAVIFYIFEDMAIPMLELKSFKYFKGSLLPSLIPEHEIYGIEQTHYFSQKTLFSINKYY